MLAELVEDLHEVMQLGRAFDLVVELVDASRPDVGAKGTQTYLDRPVQAGFGDEPVWAGRVTRGPVRGQLLVDLVFAIVDEAILRDIAHAHLGL